MAARAGLTRHDVVGEALRMLDEGGRLADITLGELARRLGIRPQSLYAHVDGTDGLARAVAVAGLHALASDVTEAAIGASGTDAAAAVVRAHLSFARRRPGLYEAAIHPPGDDPDLLLAIDAAGSPLERILTSMGIEPDERVHWTRVFLASVYGFAVLQQAGRFALPVATSVSEDRLVEMLTDSLLTRTA
ncbi:MAG: TetR-like C-terminal domain-containing protein [Acidimicrobiales bacterium]